MAYPVAVLLVLMVSKPLSEKTSYVYAAALAKVSEPAMLDPVTVC